MINWAFHEVMCKARIALYEDAVETGRTFGSIRTEFKYRRLALRYKKLLAFIEHRAALIKPTIVQP